MSDLLHLRMLGPLEVTRGGSHIGPAGVKRHSLLALLALRANEVIGIGELVEGMWGDGAPRTATALVHTYVSTWRKALESPGDAANDRISTVGGGYRLALAPEECDLLEFVRLADRGEQAIAEGRHAAGQALLAEALALWRGRAMPELIDEPFYAVAVPPLEDRRVQVVEDWSRSVLDCGTDGDLSAVLAALKRVRTEQPWREGATELLLWTLFRRGRQREAIEVFQATRRALAEDLGVDPGPDLQRMHERVLRHDGSLLLPSPAPASSLHIRSDTFVGRQRELQEASALLRAHRLVTLTGPAGSGKTRLAEELAARADVEVVLVDLSSVSDPAVVRSTIATRLGLARGEPLAMLEVRLEHRPLLLVLDNLEHLAGVGATITALLRSATELIVLATSRDPVRIADEQQYEVSPLPVPLVGERDLVVLSATAAMELLTVRARASDADFRLTDGNAAAMVQIVRALDGLPLALEIVAPWLPALAPDGVLAQLDGLLDMPVRRADIDPRHRTLRNALSWSFERLTRNEQVLLARLSVLRGGGELDAIRAVGGSDLTAPVVDVLVDLVDRHLVQPPGTTEGAPRFRLLETVRQFAAERLVADGDVGPTEARAAAWFARWAVWLAAHSEGPGTAAWLAQAVADADNLRAAMDTLERGPPDAAHLGLVVDTMVLWFEAGNESEGRARLQRALAAAPQGAPAQPMGLAYLAWLVAGHDRPRAADLARRAVDLARQAGDEPVLAFALQTLGEALDDVDAAQDASARAVGVARMVGRRAVTYGPTAGDAVACGATQNFAAVWAHRSVPTALKWQRRALTLAEVEGDRRITAANYARLGQLHLLACDVAAASGPIRRAAALITGPVTARWEDIVVFAQARLLQYEGQAEAAEATYRALATSALTGGRLMHLTPSCAALADLLIDRGMLEDAAGALRRAEDAFTVGVDRRHAAQVGVRRARLLRLDGRSDEAAALLEETRSGIDEAALTSEHIVWLVESALLADEPERRRWVARLEALSRRTGVQVPSWEKRLLVDVAPGGHAR